MLYSQLASPPIVAGFPALAHRIVNKEIPYGTDIIVGIHARLLKERHILPLEQVANTSLPGPSKSTEPVARDLSASDTSEDSTLDPSSGRSSL